MAEPELRRGDLVEVKSPAEILDTLDQHGDLEGMPFMPEMAAFCGRRFTVERRAEKVCDTILLGSRRLPRTVLLDDLRCDGSCHGGCQAECRIFWKEDWLRRVAADAPEPAPFPERDKAALIERTMRNASSSIESPGRKHEIRYRCQATELTNCSKLLRTFDPRPYLREYTSGNVPLRPFLRVLGRAVVEEPMRKLGLIPEALQVFLPGTREKGAAFQPLLLQPGEWVRVKSKEEIARTLDKRGRNKGLWFDREMLPFCGRVFRVRRRVERFIYEGGGNMIVLRNDAVTLEDVFCTGDLNLRRWFCPRAIYPYWRECWLERAPAPDVTAAQPSGKLDRKRRTQFSAPAPAAASPPGQPRTSS
jgi:hypothetical protein